MKDASRQSGNGNLFAGIRGPLRDENITALITTPLMKIERIVSTGHASPPDFWYDQEWAEWVTIIAGSATILFEDEAEPRALEIGDYLLIPPHRRHRVTRTDPDRPTIWLAVHFKS